MSIKQPPKTNSNSLFDSRQFSSLLNSIALSLLPLFEENKLLIFAHFNCSEIILPFLILHGVNGA